MGLRALVASVVVVASLGSGLVACGDKGKGKEEEKKSEPKQPDTACKKFVDLQAEDRKKEGKEPKDADKEQKECVKDLSEMKTENVPLYDCSLPCADKAKWEEALSCIVACSTKHEKSAKPAAGSSSAAPE